MRRREFLAMAGVVLALPRASFAQQPPAKVPRIVVLSNSMPESTKRNLLQGLADYGYVDGKNVVIEYLTAPTIGDVPAYAARAVALKPDVIMTQQSPAPLALKELTSTIPVVMAGLNDPVLIGAVSSYVRPGGNMTGIMNASPDSLGKMLELIHEAIPGIAGVGLMGLADDPVYPPLLRQIDISAHALGLAGIPMATREGDDFDALFARAKQQGARAIFVFNGNYLKQMPVSAELTRLAVKHQIPIFSNSTPAARDGGMILGYQGDGFAMNPEVNSTRRAGYYVDLILKGAKPGDLPIEGPTNYSLVVNLKTAKALGLNIPYSVLLQATEVIE
jgi:putative ABC transport system substrate-binding protein